MFFDIFFISLSLPARVGPTSRCTKVELNERESQLAINFTQRTTPLSAIACHNRVLNVEPSFQLLQVIDRARRLGSTLTRRLPFLSIFFSWRSTRWCYSVKLEAMQLRERAATKSLMNGLQLWCWLFKNTAPNRQMRMVKEFSTVELAFNKKEFKNNISPFFFLCRFYDFMFSPAHSVNNSKFPSRRFQ